MNSNGEVTYQDNIRPIENAIKQIIQTLSTSTSTPIGRALFSRFLLSSKYIHRLHCMDNDEQFKQLQKLITSQVWNRYTVSDGGQNYGRTHAACLPADHRNNAILSVSVVYLWSAGQNQN